MNHICTDLFLLFFRTGLLTIGNSHAGVAPVRHHVVSRRSWLTDEEFLDAISVAQAMPGVFSLNFSAYVGRKVKGRLGSAAAIAGTALPALLTLLIVATFFFDLRESAGMTAFLKGVRPALVALVALPCVQLGRAARITLSNVWLPVGAAALIRFWNVSPAYIVAFAALCGYLYGRYVRPVE